MGPWHGCHGVRLHPPELASPYGTTYGTPLVDAELRVGAVPPGGGRELWRITTEVELPDGPRPVDQRMFLGTDGSYVLQTLSGPLLAVDTSAKQITTTGTGDAVTFQLVTTFALPLLLHETGVPVLHASACARDGRAVVVAGTSGAGKSSLLVALTEAGWQPLSEDLCAIELGLHGPVVWPGPPWVRRHTGLPGPVGGSPLFETPDKTAWDLAPHRGERPVPVGAIVVMQPPGGDEVAWTPVNRRAAIAELARHAVWEGRPEERPRALFGPCASLAGAVPVALVRAPVDPAWADAVSEVLAGRI